MKVILDQEGIHYKSLFKKQTILWEQLYDVLIVVRQRRNMPDYYNYQEWIQSGNSSNGSFLLFRRNQSFPENPMFMFSLPVTQNYISVQYRDKINDLLQKYYKPGSKKEVADVKK
ncbi:hypothetical protein ACYSNX_00065 [Myroides sp. LJL115]